MYCDAAEFEQNTLVKFCVKFICQFLLCEKIYIVLSLSISTKTLNENCSERSEAEPGATEGRLPRVAAWVQSARELGREK